MFGLGVRSTIVGGGGGGRYTGRGWKAERPLGHEGIRGHEHGGRPATGDHPFGWRRLRLMTPTTTRMPREEMPPPKTTHTTTATNNNSSINNTSDKN